MTSQSGKQVITIHILPSISRNKRNHKIEFDQLIEFNMEISFLKNNTQNMLEKLVPEPFLQNQN